MAVLPTEADVGPLPSVGQQRQPVGSYDPSAIAAGARQLGQGVENLGQGLTVFGVDQQRQQSNLDEAQATSAAAVSAVRTREAASTATDPAQLDAIHQQHIQDMNAAAGMIRNPQSQQQFVTKMAPTVAETLATLQNRGRGIGISQDQAAELQGRTTTINTALSTDSDPARFALIKSHDQVIDALVAKGSYTPLQGQDAKQNFAHDYAAASAETLIAKAKAAGDPSLLGPLSTALAPQAAGGAVNTAIPPEGRALLDTIAGPEAGRGGYNARYPGGTFNNGFADHPRTAAPIASGPDAGSTSDAAGRYQFLSSTWDGEAKKLGLKDFSPANQDAAAWDLAQTAYRQKTGGDLSAALKSNDPKQLAAVASALSGQWSSLPGGHQPGTTSNAFVSAFQGNLGKAGQAGAGPLPLTNDDAREKAIALGQIPADNDVGGQPGGATPPPPTGSVYDFLRPDERAALQMRVQNAAQEIGVGQQSALKAKAEDGMAEAARTGTVTNPLQAADFVKALGPQRGPEAYQSYSHAVQTGIDAASAAKMSPDDQQALLARYQPQPGAPGYAEQAQRYDQLGKAVQAVNAEKQKDPAGFAINRLPVVSDAYQALGTAIGSPTATETDRQAAARDYVLKTQAEQGRVGIFADQQRLLPNSYVDDLNKRLTNPAAEPGGSLTVAAQMQQEAKLWGSAWPQVYRQLAPKVEPLARVLGAGVTPAGATILGNIASMSDKEVLKTQDDDKVAELNKEVLDAMKPFAQSLVGGSEASQTVRDYVDVGRKLAAYYASRGNDARTAAQLAYGDLIGSKYDFQDTYRVPKEAGVDPTMISRGAAAARRDLGQFDLAPPIDTIGGLSPAYLKAAVASSYARKGTWVTAPDESGLMLIGDDDMAARTASGKPLIVPWKQLSDMGKGVTRDAAGIEPIPSQ